jgi:hypothetical protein
MIIVFFLQTVSMLSMNIFKLCCLCSAQDSAFACAAFFRGMSDAA